MVLSYLSAAEVASIRGEFRNLKATIGELNDWPVVTFERAGVEIGAVACITIRLADRAERTTGAGTAATGTEADGTLKAWADTFTRSIRQGDRFVWQDQACAVTTGAIEKFGVVSIEFALMTGNRGGV